MGLDPFPFWIQVKSGLYNIISIKEQKKKKNTKLNVMDYVKLSAFLSEQIPIAFKIIIKLDYIER